ncbi:probable hydrolase PNKD [Myxocyprinus asiaticus]|uniref:probable hydrolase PNKD n=1 Tax=Myxocyprinus asiaticus TaxID=70543 RepID=UPI002221DCC0|nr:probable hydrolase PNKD [Myxocyprinus asiaticus]
MITPVPIPSDNYSYVVIDTTSNLAVVVDPANTQPVQACLEEEWVMFKLFSAQTNIGRMFEGNAPTMLSSLDTVGSLNNDPLLWPGHEYAEDNLLFAAELEPCNIMWEQKLQWVLQQRGQRLCMCPSTLADEKQYNPFLWSHTQDLHCALGLQQKQNEDWTSYRAHVLEEQRRQKDIYMGQ